MRNRVDVMHGVNFDVLERRPGGHYPPLTLTELEVAVKRSAQDLGLQLRFSQTNHEGEFCELLHRSAERADGLLLNPGAWTHYSWAIRDALEVAGIPAVEVHLSSVEEREDWRRISVIRDLCVGCVQGQGVAGYKQALELLRRELVG